MVVCFAKAAVNWGGSSQHQQTAPLYDLQFEDLSILERRTSSDVLSATGLLLIIIHHIAEWLACWTQAQKGLGF